MVHMVQGQDPLTLNSGLDVEVERVEDRLVSLVRKVSRATVRCTSHTSHAHPWSRHCLHTH